MAKQKQPLSSYQKGIIRRYYEHKADLAHQSLSEMVSELYLETNEKKKALLWKKVETALTNAGTDKAEVEKIIAEKSLESLAKFATETF